MKEPMIPPLFCDRAVLAYRSSAPVDGRRAARLGDAILRPPERRDWAAPPPRELSAGGPLRPRFLSGELFLDRRASQSYGDVLWLVAQLARFARDEQIEFEVQLGALNGRVSTGGLDRAALQILSQVEGAASPEASAMPVQLRERRQLRASQTRAG